MNVPYGLMPVLSLRNTVIFPGLTQVIKVGRERSMNALNVADKNGYWVVAVQQKTHDSAIEKPIEPDDLYSVGTLCRIDSIKGSKETSYQVVLRGHSRVKLEDIHIHPDNYVEAQTTELIDIIDMDKNTSAALLDSLKTQAREILKLIPVPTESLAELVNSVDDLSLLTSLIIGNIEVDLREKQNVLEMTHLKERALHLLNLLQELKANLSIQAEIRGKMTQKLGQAQRQTILREQLKMIREELGEGDDSTVEEKIQKKIEDAHMPEEVKKIAEQEYKRFTEVGTQSPESHIIRNYLELLTDLPWSKSSVEKEIDLQEARRSLDQDHYGIDKVKRRIIQHLAVMRLKKDTKGSILLFIGPPGVGKTSLGQSIAKVLNRKFARVSLGGVRDDAEIRGHRRTYIGAMPGRLIQALKRVGENNPVFLLDEIDKLARSFNGDPAAALLEALDPEQNSNFLDHYLDVGFDLSKVFFIATANSLEGIPGPLLDRMEVIDLSGYTLSEKMHIAKNHLIPKVLKEFGVTPEQIQISDEVIMRVISQYTREAGVRDLQRQLSTLVRASCEKIIEQKFVRIENKNLEELLGPEKFSSEVAENLSSAGVTTGLAWSPVGGSILFIESTAMPGKGELLITGQLGEVMKESAQIALSLVRTHLSSLGLAYDPLKTDIHVHVPAGAIPKDGPSAGITMLSSVASLLTQRPVKSKLAMTGEITLRGAVLAVGGIKEKLIAAHRAGIEEVILPRKNERDLKELPDEVKQQLKIYLVDSAKDVLKIALNLTEQNFAMAGGVFASPPPPPPTT